MKNLTSFQRKRAKHLMKNGKIKNLKDRAFPIRWAIRKWGKSTVFGSEYHKFFGRMFLYDLEVIRLHVKVGRLEWETWAWAYSSATYGDFLNSLRKGGF